MEPSSHLFKKARKKTTIQLTSLLDLLFVMIFVSLLQQKAPQVVKTQQTTPIPVPAPIVAKKIEPIIKPKANAKMAIEAQFHFYATASGPRIPQGKYLMQGTYNQETGQLRLGGVGWLERPQHYDMVPLSGKVGPSKQTFTGRIEFQSCKEFTLKRTSTNGSSDISGTWEGSYECAQGATGLTLTIL